MFTRDHIAQLHTYADANPHISKMVFEHVTDFTTNNEANYVNWYFKALIMAMNQGLSDNWFRQDHLKVTAKINALDPK